MRSLRTRFLVVMGLGLVPLLAFEIHNESAARQFRAELMRDEALRLVRLVDAGQRHIADSAEQVLGVLVRTPSVQDHVPGQCTRLFANVQANSERISTVVLFDLNGHPTCQAPQLDPSEAAADRPYFQRALQGAGLAVGDYAVGRRTGVSSLHVAQAIPGPDGKPAGVIALSLRLDWLQQQLDQLSLPRGAVATVADRNGVILARAPRAVRLPATPERPEMVFNPQLLQGDQIQVADILGRSQRPRLVAFIPPASSPTGLMVSVSLDRATAFAAVTRQDWDGEALIVAGAVLALLVAALSGNRLIRRPLERLLDATARWRTGDLGARTGLRHDRSEFGRLANALDDLAATLADREATLRASETRLLLSQEAGRVGIWEWNLDTDEQHWSDVQRRLFGMPP